MVCYHSLSPFEDNIFPGLGDLYTNQSLTVSKEDRCFVHRPQHSIIFLVVYKSISDVPWITAVV